MRAGRTCSRPCRSLRTLSPNGQSRPNKKSIDLKGINMALKRVGSQPSIKGPEQYFTGTVRIDMLNAPPPPARASAAHVTFEPGARSAWHTHPLGQTLVVTFGCGWTQCEGEPKVEIRAGDV